MTRAHWAGRGQRARERVEAVAKEPEAEAVPSGRIQPFSLPNILSVTRVALLPILIYYLRSDSHGAETKALGLLVLASLTDWFDGFLARRLGQASYVGRILDPVADKLLVGGTLVAVTLTRPFPSWALALILLRDLLILAAGVILVRRWKVVFPPNMIGRLTTVALACMLAAYVLRWYSLATYLLGASLFGVVASGYSYLARLIQFWARVREGPGGSSSR